MLVEEKKADKIGSGIKKSIDASQISVFKTPFLRALTDQTRQGIIMVLGKEKSLCVNDLAAHFNVSRPTVSHHLNVLKEAKMVKSTKLGKEVYYGLNARNLKRSLNNLLKIIESIDKGIPEGGVE